MGPYTVVASEANAIVAQVPISSGQITSSRLKNITLATIKAQFRVYVDGLELITRQDTTVADKATGTINLNTSVYDGFTAYLYFKNLGVTQEGMEQDNSVDAISWGSLWD